MDKNVSPSIIPDFHALLITPAAMRIHDEHLSAYIDGRLQTEEKAAVEARLKDDAAFEAEYRSLHAVKNVLQARQEKLRVSAPVEARRSVLLSLEQEWKRKATLERISHQSHAQEYQHAAPLPATPQFRRSPMLRNSMLRNSPKIISLMWQRPYTLVAVMAVLVVGWVALRFSLQTRSIPTPASPETVQNSVANAVLNDVPQTVFVKESLQNYRAVRSGQITLQCKTASFEALDKFFHKAGVHYNIVHPKIDAQLLGGVVSEENGKKSAHLVFKHGETLVYMWEIDLDDKTAAHASIHNEAWAALHKGEWLWDTKTDTSMTVVFWEDEKQGHRTLCSVVAALPRTNLQPLFQ